MKKYWQSGIIVTLQGSIKWNLLPKLLNNLSYGAEMFDFTAWHQMASSAFHVIAFDRNDSGQSKVIKWNVLEAIECQAVKPYISTTWDRFFVLTELAFTHK